MEDDSGFSHHGIASRAEVLCHFVTVFGFIGNFSSLVELNLSSVEEVILRKLSYFFFFFFLLFFFLLGSLKSFWQTVSL